MSEIPPAKLGRDDLRVDYFTGPGSSDGSIDGSLDSVVLDPRLEVLMEIVGLGNMGLLGTDEELYNFYSALELIVDVRIRIGALLPYGEGPVFATLDEYDEYLCVLRELNCPDGERSQRDRRKPRGLKPYRPKFHLRRKPSSRRRVRAGIRREKKGW